MSLQTRGLLSVHHKVQAQGEMVNFAVPGEGNTVIPANPKAESYLAVLKRLIEMSTSDLARLLLFVSVAFWRRGCLLPST